jgi:hypothetical protein
MHVVLVWVLHLTAFVDCNKDQQERVLRKVHS